MVLKELLTIMKFRPHSFLAGNSRLVLVLGLRLLLIKAAAQTNILPSPDFFPIGVWLQAPTNAVKYRQAGFNLYVGLWEGPREDQLTALRKAGVRVICFQNETDLRHLDDTNIFAWKHDDEPDNSRTRGARFGFGSPIPPEKVVEGYRRMKSNDLTRPVFVNLGQGVAWDGWYVAVAVAVLLMWIVILLVARLGGHVGGGGFVRDTMTRFMGLIVIAMGIQFALTGLRAFMMASQ